MKYIWCQHPNYQNVAEWCLDDVLGMKDYDLNIKWQIFLDSHQGEFIPPKDIFITQDAQDFDALRVLFHELRHYFQFKTEMYNFIPSARTKTFTSKIPELACLERYLDYKMFPWELDADKFAVETMRRFWKEPISNFHKQTR